MANGEISADHKHQVLNKNIKDQLRQRSNKQTKNVLLS